MYLIYLKKFSHDISLAIPNANYPFHTQTDLIENEFLRLADILLTDNDVYSHHKYDIGRTKQNLIYPL